MKRKTQSVKRKVSRTALGYGAGSRPILNGWREKFLVLSFSFALFALHSTLIAPIFAQPVSSTELINNANQYDGKIVVYEGEVIGEVMLRGDYAWANLNDGRSAIGIWLPKALTKEIVFTGSYKARGDWIEVVGIFQRACAEHGGDLDIHAQAIRKIGPGRQVLERLNLGKKNLALGLLGLLAILWILRRLKRK